MKAVFAMKKIYLRRAKASDMDIFYAWRNEDEVRKNSFQKDWVKYKEHETWFLKALSSPKEKMYVLLVNDERIGQIRLTLKDEGLYITYSIAREYRGQGYGKILLRLMENEVYEDNHDTKLIAEVKKQNVASQVVFKTMGYQETEGEEFFSYTKFPQYQKVIIENNYPGGGTRINQ